MKFLLPLLLLIGSLFSSEEHFRKIPKAELHLHLGGAYPLPYLLTLATEEQKAQLQNELNRIAKSLPYHECFSVFGIVAQIVNTEEKVEKGVEALCNFLADDGVVYAEIRTGLKDFGRGFESYLQAVLRGASSERLQTRLLLSLQRSSSLETAKKTIDLALKYKAQGVIGIDLSGDSTIGNIETILPELLRAKNEGLFLTLHIGESPQEKDQLLLLEKIQPDRIGHAVHLQKEALDWVLEHRIPLEVCLTSSSLVQMVEQGKEHPALQYYRQGHPIALCTDDPLIFQTSLSQELDLLLEQGAFTRDEAEELALDALEYSFSR